MLSCQTGQLFLALWSQSSIAKYKCTVPSQKLLNSTGLLSKCFLRVKKLHSLILLLSSHPQLCLLRENQPEGLTSQLGCQLGASGVQPHQQEKVFGLSDNYLLVRDLFYSFFHFSIKHVLSSYSVQGMLSFTSVVRVLVLF